jgi:hypothetical protein
MLTIKALLTRIVAFRAQGVQLRAALNRLQPLTIAKAARDAVDILESNEFFRRSPDSHKAQVHQDYIREFTEHRTVAAKYLMFLAGRDLPALDADIRTLRNQLKAAPSPVDAYLARTGGSRINISDQTELLISLLDEQRRARYRAELQDAPPSVVRDLYARAVSDKSDDESASLVRFIEAQHGEGWRGPQPTTTEQVEAAANLRKRIAATQALRVPTALDDAQDVLTTVAGLVSKAEHVYSLRPLDIDREPDAVREVWQDEQIAITEAARELEAEYERQAS